MDSYQWLQFIGGIVGILAGVAVSVMMFLLKGWIEQAQQTAEARESRYQAQFERINTSLRKVENDGAELAKHTAERFEDLQDRYIPRREMEEIAKGIRQSSETNLAYLKKVDRQVDTLTQLFLKGEQDG